MPPRSVTSNEWFQTYYGAANATLVHRRRHRLRTATAEGQHYFGDIPPGPPVARFTSWIAKRNGSQREVTQDRVPQARLYKVWNTPAYAEADATRLGLVADVLASGKTSRLYKRLVYDEQIASEVSASAYPSEIGGQFCITATARPGQDLAAVERAVDEELTRFIADGPTADELERVKMEKIAGFIRDLEGVGGFGGKANTLAEAQVFGGSASCRKRICAACARRHRANFVKRRNSGSATACTCSKCIHSRPTRPRRPARPGRTGMDALRARTRRR